MVNSITDLYSPIFSPYRQIDDKGNILLHYYLLNNKSADNRIVVVKDNGDEAIFEIEQAVQPFAIYADTLYEIWYTLTLPEIDYKDRIIHCYLSSDTAGLNRSAKATTLNLIATDIIKDAGVLTVTNNNSRLIFTVDAAEDYLKTAFFVINEKKYEAQLNSDCLVATLEFNDLENVKFINVLYTTNNGYIFNQNCAVVLETLVSSTDYSLDITVAPAEDLGSNSIQIKFAPLAATPETSKLVAMDISRENEETNIIDVFSFDLIELPFDKEIIYLDETIEADTSYSYIVTIKDKDTGAIIIQAKADEISNYYDDMYLINLEGRLKIKYNPKVSSLKYNYQDSVTATLGSDFPFIRRNGKQKYRSFQIEGLISYQAEYYETVFDTIKDSVGPSLAIDQNISYDFINKYYYNKIKNLSIEDNKKNYRLEKHYRDNVIKFLQDGKIKLFKSAQEGLILVRLTNISLTPNEQLGRTIYSFSATATEIAEANFDNYRKYHIIDKRLFSDIDYIFIDYYIIAQGFDANNTPILQTDQGVNVVNNQAQIIVTQTQTAYKENTLV